MAREGSQGGQMLHVISVFDQQTPRSKRKGGNEMSVEKNERKQILGSFSKEEEKQQVEGRKP